MDPKNLENPYSAASRPPENPSTSHRRRVSPLETHPPSPFNGFHHLEPDQIRHIESAFSRLAVSADRRFHAQTPSLLTPDPFSPPESAPTLREPPQPLFWAPHITGANGSFGGHWRSNAGANPMRILGGPSPYTHADGHWLTRYHQSQDLCDDYLSILHGVEQYSRNPGNCYPISPYAQQQSIIATHSHRPLNKRQPPQITPEILRGGIVSLAKDPLWSGALNLKVEEGLSEEEVELVLREVANCLSDLMMDQFGSQFVHKFFLACNEDRRTRIIMSLTNSPYKIVTICLNSYGAGAVQKLLEKLSTPQQISLVVSALSPGAVSLVNDPCGHHVIQYCIRNFTGEYNKHLFNEMADNCFKIATNKSGCCVLPTCLEYAHAEARERLIRDIIANAVHLAEDPYGNYVVQHLIGSGTQEVKTNLLRRLQGSFVSLSCNKYASNVVEKILQESSANHTTAIIMELLTSPNASMLLLDPFGNFVIQSALSVAKGHILDALLHMIRANAPSMQSNLYGKKILDSIEKRRLRKGL